MFLVLFEQFIQVGLYLGEKGWDGAYIRVRLILGMLTGQHVWGHIFGRGYISGPNKQDFTVYKNSAVVSNFIHLDRIQIICKSLYAS